MEVKEYDKIDEDIKKAIRWAAAEYKYISELKDKLDEVEKETANENIKELKKLLRLAKYIGKAERRAFKFEEKVEKDIKTIFTGLAQHIQTKFSKKTLGKNFSQLKDIMQVIRKISKDLKIEHSSLLEYASFYEGQLKEELNEARALEKLKKKKIEKDNPKKSKKIHKSFIGLIEDIKVMVTDAKKWVRSLEISLKKAEQLNKKIEHIEDEFFSYKKPSFKMDPKKIFKDSKKEKKEVIKRFRKIEKILKSNNDSTGLELLRELIDLCSRYIEKMVNFEVELKRIKRKFGGDRTAMVIETEELEKERRNTHEALISQITIFNRYLGKKYKWETKNGIIPLGGIIERSFLEKLKNYKSWKGKEPRRIIGGSGILFLDYLKKLLNSNKNTKVYKIPILGITT